MVSNNTTERRSSDRDVDLAGGEFSSFTVEEAADDRILRSSLWAAVGLHILLLMINFPAFSDRADAAEPPEKKVYVVRTVRFEPPPVAKTPIPPKRVRRTPVPDKTPDGPEILPLEAAPLEIAMVDAPIEFTIPEAPPEPDPVGAIQVGGEVRKPEKILVIQPQYTELARRARIQGQVIVEAIIDRQGNVTNVKVLKGLSMGLSEEAVQAVRQWKFKPATLRGKPVDVYYNLTVRFQLQ